jgi:hypothetical protein
MFRGLGRAFGLVMDAGNRGPPRGNALAHDEEPLLANPPTQDVAVHVRDYERFTRLMFRGAIVCLIVGFIVLLILK